MKRQSLSIAGLLAAWAVITVSAFWVFEGRYLRPASRPPGAATPHVSVPPPGVMATLRTDRGEVALGVAGPIMVLNFWNPDCACSRFAEPEVAALAARSEPQGVRFVTVIASGASPQEQRRALALWRARHVLARDPALADAGNRLALALGVWAAPAAVILDRRGRIAYVGAYNAGRFCSDSRTGWAAQALAAVARGQRPDHPTMPFYGCQLLAAKP